MKENGLVREVDDMGRIVLPKELLKYLNMENVKAVQIFVENNSIVLKKYNPGCIFCNNVDNTIRYKGQYICKDCLKDMEER